MPKYSQSEDEFVTGQSVPAQLAGAGPATRAVEAPAMQRRQELDAREMSSPIALLTANSLLGNMQPGDVLRVVTGNERRTMAEFQALARHTGHYLISQTETPGGILHLLKRRH